MMRSGVALLVLVLACSPVAAEQAPFDFKGIALGSDISSVENTGRFSCRDPQSPIADRVGSQVAGALTEKYGEGAVKTEAVQNRMGATFENRIHSWRRDNAMLEAKRYSSKLDRSSVTYRTDFALQEFERRRGATAKEKAKDL